MRETPDRAPDPRRTVYGTDTTDTLATLVEAETNDDGTITVRSVVQVERETHPRREKP